MESTILPQEQLTDAQLVVAAIKIHDFIDWVNTLPERKRKTLYESAQITLSTANELSHYKVLFDTNRKT